MHNFITWYDILTVFIWTISIYTVIAVILLAISHFTEKMRIKKSGLPQVNPQLKKRFKIVDSSDLKTCLYREINGCDEHCQNRMANGKCTSFVCTKIVRFK